MTSNPGAAKEGSGTQKTQGAYTQTPWAFGSVAERTGLEPATPGVTGRYSNQLNYRSMVGADGLEPPTFAL